MGKLVHQQHNVPISLLVMLLKHYEATKHLLDHYKDIH